MNPGAIPRCFGLIPKQFVVFAANPSKRLERLGVLAFPVIQRLSPRLLVVPLDCRVRFGDYPAKAVRPDTFGIRKMRNDLPHTPLVRSRAKIDLRTRRSGQRRGDQFRSPAEALEQFSYFTHKEQDATAC